MTKGCYTCRRRRIICDNGQPTCRKCRDAGKECLGYQKPLVWVKGGVASRGKMMGRSFDDVNNPASEPRRQPPAEARPPSNSGLGLFPLAKSSSDIESPGSAAHARSEPDTWVQKKVEYTGFRDFIEDIEETMRRIKPSEEPLEEPLEELDNRVVHLPRESSLTYVPAPWVLVDPLHKDLSQSARFYLFHYNQHMVEDFTVYDQIQNPWRDILSLVGSSPAVAHGIAAMGALHYSLRSQSDSSLMPWSSLDINSPTSHLSAEEIESIVTPAGSRRPSSKAYQHFLEFKQRTLAQLSRDLSNPTMQKDDRTLAAIVVLALVDLFESGSGAWCYHIEGAKKLLKSRPENQLSTGILQGLETFAIDGCLIMEIMGSTLARPGVLSKPFYSAAMGPAMLKRLEVTSWVGCPAYLLEVIFFVHGLWYPDSDITATPQPTAFPFPMQQGQQLTLESFAALLQGIRNFDPLAWAHELQTFFFLQDLSPRIALATAYKAAVYLYTSRVLSRTRMGFSPPWTDVGVPADHSLVTDELIVQICSVPHSDPHFKCLIWPTFIAGAECRRSQRGLVLEKLEALYQAVTSINVRNAAWVLRLMWQKQDTRRTQRREDHTLGSHQDSAASVLFDDDGNDDYDIDNSVDWIDELDESRLDWLFI